MKKILLILIAFVGCIIQVNADDNYFLWHNSMDNAYTTNYDGMISDSVGKYQNNTIESLGNHEIKLNNFNAYDVMLYEQTTWELNGNNTIKFIEQSSDSHIILKGNGVLKFQEIGLSMSDMLNSKTPNLEERIKIYLKGNYTLNIEENLIVIRLNNKAPTSGNSGINNNQSENNSEKNESTNDKSETNSEKDEPVNNKDETNSNESEAKALSFENKSFNITIKSNSKVPTGTIFKVEDILESLKEKVNEKLNNEEAKYIYDFELQNEDNNIEPTEEVEVSIKLDDGKYIVYYYNEKEELEKIDSNYENGYLKFKTSHFSKYVIATSKEVVNTKEESKKDNKLIIGISIAVVAVVAVIIVIVKKKIHK